MNFPDLVGASHVVLQLAAEDKWRALCELCHIASAEGLAVGVGADVLLEAVEERERSLSTALEAGLAIPHAFLPGLPHAALIFAVAPAGIPWGALDGEPARLIALLIAPETEDARATHLQVLASLSGAWVEPSRRAAALAAPDAAVLRAVLSGT